jgi:hypothetical protein
MDGWKTKGTFHKVIAKGILKHVDLGTQLQIKIIIIIIIIIIKLRALIKK